jgi:predicted membrane channel-forming protein YqfA (hemolysin III family)
MHTPIDRYCIVFIGVVFYVSAFPESVYPGLFDLAWYSHMWWHIMVATSFVRMYYLWTDLRDYRANNGCPTHV